MFDGLVHEIGKHYSGKPVLGKNSSKDDITVFFCELTTVFAKHWPKFSYLHFYLKNRHRMPSKHISLGQAQLCYTTLTAEALGVEPNIH